MAEPYSQPTASPTQKVAAAGIAGAVSVLLIYLVQTIFNIVIPAEVSSSITAILAFASGYLIRETK